MNTGGAKGGRQDEEAEPEEVAEVAPPQGLM